jgi:hypothetical protein
LDVHVLFVSRSRGDLHIKPFLGELRSWKAAARRDGETLTDWIRMHLNVLAVPVPPPVPPVVSGDQIDLPLDNERKRAP